MLILTKNFTSKGVSLMCLFFVVFVSSNCKNIEKSTQEKAKAEQKEKSKTPWELAYDKCQPNEELIGDCDYLAYHVADSIMQQMYNDKLNKLNEILKTERENAENESEIWPPDIIEEMIENLTSMYDGFITMRNSRKNHIESLGYGGGGSGRGVEAAKDGLKCTAEFISWLEEMEMPS